MLHRTIKHHRCCRLKSYFLFYYPLLKKATMKKILAVVDSLNYKEEQLDTIEYVSGILKSNLTIVMPQEINGSSFLTSSDFAANAPASYFELGIRASGEKDDIIKHNTAAMRMACQARNLFCAMYGDRAATPEEIILESRFADLVLLGKELSLHLQFDNGPTGSVRDVLANAECPVLVTSEDMPAVKGVVFTYNGTYSSMYAIRSFTGMFPEIVTQHATVIYINEKENKAMPHERLLREYLGAYNRNISYMTLSGKADTVIQAYLEQKPDHITTLGAHGRSRLSRFFNSSTAGYILRTTKGPLFITHD